MGRRKERRLAALSATSRRVKLDLFAEPSGDLGGSSVQNEVGGNEDDTNNQAGLPNSPSSSGKQPENPLVLLGQYSDDESDDEGSSGEQHQAVAGDTLDILNDQEKLAAVQGSEDFAIKEGKDPSAQKVEQLDMMNGPALLDSLQKLDEVGATENHGIDLVVVDETCLTEQASGTIDTQSVGDVISGWKIVLHEETKGYYYWNIASGETSWEMPDVLSRATESTYGKKDAADTEGKEKASDGSIMTHQNSETDGSYTHEPLMEVLHESYKGEDSDDNIGNHDKEQNHVKRTGIQNHVTSPGSHVDFRKSDDVLLGDGNATSVESLNYESRIDPSTLVKQCEDLLEQLNSVKGSRNNLEGHGQISKYVVEVEMRLADIKSLASYGSSLFPFWVHSERRLQQLEAAINDVLPFSEQCNADDATHESHEKMYEDNRTSCSDTEAVYPSLGDFVTPELARITHLQSKYLEANNGGAATAELVHSDGYTMYSGNAAGGKGEVDGLAMCESTPKTVLNTGEEEDMDVDMEVEDVPPSSSTLADPSVAQYHGPSKQLNQSNLTADQDSSADQVPNIMLGVPPPPDEDWIPPPPPDNEPFPPPPPDEPPEIPYPQPSDLVSVQSLSYTEQYNMPYTGSHYEYYGQANSDLPSSNFYAIAEASQPAVAHPALYYEPLSDTYGLATLTVNFVEPSVSYGLQDGTPQPSEESFRFQPVSVHKNPITEAMGSLDAHAQISSASLLKAEVNVPAVVAEADKASLGIPSSESPSHDSTTISGTLAVSVSSVPAVTGSATASAAAPKAHSKVPRDKKRTVAVISSLRSNKKVSSLVDKWKAAKEELQEVEEEPENTLEILERKQQRAIEEWHAQQIASGEAKDNSNFQPLGGDWRKRVKRKRAQLANESVQTPSNGITEANPQPDLIDLSKGLPNGWQAYWDDSSKQVYYGNSFTSETTWIRPTN